MADSSRKMHDREQRRYRDGGYEAKLDDPPNSRLFIVCNKNITEEDFRQGFEKYGTIEEIWVVKDRATGEPKGITYIKFSKTSEAAQALEEMNGSCIGKHPRPLKVMIAHSREQGSRRELNEEERLLRLFCVVPKTTTEVELREHFQEFGDIDYISIVKDRETKESKGFAYVKYHRVSHAARAYEGCNRTYKAVFAEPKRQRGIAGPVMGGPGPLGPPCPPSGAFDSGYSGGSGYCQNSGPGVGIGGNEPFGMLHGPPKEGGTTTLRVITSPMVNQDQLWRLFNIIPGLDYVQMEAKPRIGKIHATVVYFTTHAASYARDKLHGFEYPLGHRLIVKMDPDVVVARAPRGPPPPSNIRNSSGLENNLANLAETIAQATSMIQAAGLTTGKPMSNPSNSGDNYDPSYCSVQLPPPQPLAPMDSEMVQRLFLVCHPVTPAMYVLRDIFSRFGHLIDVYMLNNKNCGYVKYADKTSAEMAISTLHGQEVCGIRLKVMEADPRTNDQRRKRLKMEDDE